MIPFAHSPFSQTLRSHSKTLVMGVINTTPDSFSDGGVHLDRDVAIAAGLKMLDEGADIVDVGGESTRPGSSTVEEFVELERAVPVIAGIAQARPHAMISVDTRRSSVAQAAIRAGARVINDVSGFREDLAMIDIARESQSGLVVMHMLGRPNTMQIEINYKSFPGEILEFFRERVGALEDAGINPDNIIVDPGIGFGKTFDQNLILLNRLDHFSTLGKALLVGPSRKSFLGKILDEPVAAKRDTGTLAAITAAVLKGASIVRVHNVWDAVQACKVADAIVRERVGP